ncbi:MAG TPA: SLC13 family permease, partial [Pirellulaceae bacterium]|nr:SLC13 family permease [Pirellulaceae bacterium]
VISRGLQNAGVVSLLARVLGKVGSNPTLQVTLLTFVVAVCSAFMNNVGALALLMPVAIWMARQSDRSPSHLLMPLSFGSLLGGMTTLIGTPPNLIVSSFRNANGGQLGFGFFDFSYVGLGVMVAGILSIGLFGWRLIPNRSGSNSAEDLMKIDDYLTEVMVPESSPAVHETLRHLENELCGDLSFVVVGLVRGQKRKLAPSGHLVIRPGDILLIEADTEDLSELLKKTGFELAESREEELRALSSDEIQLVEAIVGADSVLKERTVSQIKLRTEYDINVLAVARQGQRLGKQLNQIRLIAGDILLVQGPAKKLMETLANLGCLPLAERALNLGRPQRIPVSLGLFALAITAVTIGWGDAPTAFTIAAVCMVLANILTLRDVYSAIDWPVIVLLGAMIPIGTALETTGGAATIADLIHSVGSNVPPVVILTVFLVGTMCLSDIINNAAAAVLMCPIALNVAASLGCSADPLLIAVALGASCAFLTPIGHQSNTLVMAPGGYRFGDYWRLGLPLQLVILLVAIPLIMWFWPFE